MHNQGALGAIAPQESKTDRAPKTNRPISLFSAPNPAAGAYSGLSGLRSAPKTNWVIFHVKIPNYCLENGKKNFRGLLFGCTL